MANSTTNSSITNEQRIILGCRALVRENISGLARELNTNCEFIYAQRDKAYQMLHESFNDSGINKPVLVLNKEFLEKSIIGCMVICKDSTEDTHEFLNKIYGINISTGNLSNIINRAADKAKEFN